jgi:hypothetical protein
MTEFQEYPKAVYHPETNAMFTVHNADEEETVTSEWTDAPKLPLRSTAATKPVKRAATKPVK